MRFFRHAEEALLVALFLVAFCVLVAQILSRYLLPYPLAWTEELARFLFLWIVFLGAAYLFRGNNHIAITFFIDMFPRGVRIAAYVAMQLGILVFVATVAWLGADLAWKVRKLPTIAMGISSAWEYAAVPVASALMAVRTVINIVDVSRNGLPETHDSTLL